MTKKFVSLLSTAACLVLVCAPYAATAEPTQPGPTEPTQPVPVPAQPAPPSQPDQPMPTPAPMPTPQPTPQPMPAPQPTPPAGVTEQPTERVFAKLHSMNQLEVAEANMALQNAQSQDVKNFAQKMIDDHTTAEQQLAPLAARLQLPLHSFLPETAAEMRDDQMDQYEIQKLGQLNGADFDREYLTSQVVAHKKALKWLKQKLSLVEDEGAQDFVTLQIKAIQRHLRMAIKLRNQTFS